VLFAIAVTALPPALAYGIELLVGLVSDAARRVLHLGLVGVLAGAIALQLVEPHGTAVGVALAALAAGGAVAAYLRLRAARSLLSVLAPAPLVFLVLFLALSDVSKLVFGSDVEVQAASVSSRAPVVVVVLDELPVNSLYDARRRIDARRYPNFARLAADATWYRNTTTVHADTPYAIPAIMDGRSPRKGKLPVAADHPRSIFSLLGGEYTLHVQEEATAVCPRSLCRESRPAFGRRMKGLWDDLSLVYLHTLLPDDLERDVPSVSEGWGDFRGERTGPEATTVAARTRRAGRRQRPTRQARKRTLRGHLNGGRPGRFESFVSDIRGGGRPRLHFIHALLPHVPFQYLPSGHAYRRGPGEEIPGLNSPVGFHEQFLVEQGWQRHLLQLGDADRLLGLLLDRLQRLDLYDRALVAVVADHGVSFRLDHDRRAVRPGNVEDIAPVPFFLKAPGQQRGRVSDKPLRTIDVLPTIADVLDLRIPWHVDGRSALRPTVSAQRHRQVIAKHFTHVVAVDDSPRFVPAQGAALRRKLSLFGRGLYAFGPVRQLLGRRLSELGVVRSSGPRARFIHPERFADVDPRSGFVPVHVVGRVEPGVPGGGRTVAVAVNGRVEATGITVSLEGSDDEDFSLMLPERSLRPGRNRVELLWVRDSGRIESLGAAGL
jgi:hypothetical protein